MTIRRIVIDNDHPGGWYPDNPDVRGYQYQQLFFSGPYYQVHLPPPPPDSAPAQYTDIYVWAAGFISFTPPTDEQVAFVQQYQLGQRSILEFPGIADTNDLISAGLTTRNLSSFYFQQATQGYYINWGDPIQDTTIGDFEYEECSEVFLFYVGGGLIDVGYSDTIGNYYTDGVRASRAENFGYANALRAPARVNLTGGSENDTIIGSYTYLPDNNLEVLRGMDGDDAFVPPSSTSWVDGGNGLDVLAVSYPYGLQLPDTTVDLALGTMSQAFGSSSLIGIESVVIQGESNDTLRAGDRFGNGVDILKPSAVRNLGTASAISLDGRFGLGSDAEITSATTIPHATVVANGSGFREYYSFTVTQPQSAVTIDIDHASFDTEITLLDANGTVIAFNDDSFTLDPGSTSGLESFLTFTITTPGQYFIAVTQYQGQPVPVSGGQYTLNVSLVGSRSTPIAYSLNGGGGDDLLISGTGDDRLDGSVGFDTVSYAEAAGGVVVNLATGIATGHGTDQLLNIDAVRGSAYNDQITGNGAANVLYGLAGNDTIDGAGGDDMIDGGAGIDSLFGNSGNDRLVVGSAGSGSFIDGGTGTDTLAVSGTVSLASIAGVEAIEFTGGTTLSLSGTQFANGLASNSMISGTGTLVINMTSGTAMFAAQMSVASSIALTVNGTSGIDVIKGPLTAAVTVSGGDGADQIRGGNLVDTIVGDAGNDKIMGLGGADVLTGGSGSDQFRYLFASDSTLTSQDRILDFTNGVDKLDFRALDADPTLAGRQMINFIGTAVFTAGGTAQARYLDSGADTLVQIDLNGDGTADMQIVLAGHTGQALTGADFLF